MQRQVKHNNENRHIINVFYKCSVGDAAHTHPHPFFLELKKNNSACKGLNYIPVTIDGLEYEIWEDKIFDNIPICTHSVDAKGFIFLPGSEDETTGFNYKKIAQEKNIPFVNYDPKNMTPVGCIKNLGIKKVFVSSEFFKFGENDSSTASDKPTNTFGNGCKPF